MACACSRAAVGNGKGRLPSGAGFFRAYSPSGPVQTVTLNAPQHENVSSPTLAV